MKRCNLNQCVAAGLLLGMLVAASPLTPAQQGPQTFQMTAPLEPEMAPSASSALTVGTATQKVPQGTFLTIAFNTPMDSRTIQTGDAFNAYLTDDFAMPAPDGNRRIILPAGTMVRGRVDTVKRPSFFSKGGSIFLAFDHVVLPSGDAIPLSLNLSTENTIVNKQGALYTDPGVGYKVQQGVETGKQVFTGITDNGVQAGKNIAGGLGSLVTVPASVVGGLVAGTAVTTGKAVVAVVGKGESVVIKPGDTVTIDFGGSFDLPAE